MMCDLLSEYLPKFNHLKHVQYLVQGKIWSPATEIFKTVHELPCQIKTLLPFGAALWEMTTGEGGQCGVQRVRADSFLSADVCLSSVGSWL